MPEIEEAFLEEIAALGPEGNEWAGGMSLYANNCTVCHGINGQGSDLGLPLNTEELRSREADELARIIGEGVPGTAMAGWKNSLMGGLGDALPAAFQAVGAAPPVDHLRLLHLVAPVVLGRQAGRRAHRAVHVLHPTADAADQE